jgi:hypothetical protein
MDEISELYDLFGETVYCSICLEDVLESARVRCLKSCQHIFHSNCIEKWFLEKNCCPTCRKEYTFFIKKDTQELMNDTDRLFMTWTLLHGILKKIKNATNHNERKNDIRLVLSKFRSLPVDLDTRSSLQSTKNYISNKICKLRNIHKIQIHRQPQIYQWIDKIENHDDYRSLISSVWRS